VGDAGALGGICVSDGQLKDNVVPLSDSLERVCGLEPVRFEWRAGAPEQGVATGLVAQQVEQHFPEWVTTGDDGYKRVRYDLELQMHMLAAIKTLKERGDALQQRNQGLEARVARLEALVRSRQ
jgi:hypothetical protein